MNILLIQCLKDPIVTIETVVSHTLSSIFGNSLT